MTRQCRRFTWTLKTYFVGKMIRRRRILSATILNSALMAAWSSRTQSNVTRMSLHRHQVNLGLVAQPDVGSVAQSDAVVVDSIPAGSGNIREIFSTVILSLPLIQEGKLSVFGKRMCTSTGLPLRGINLPRNKNSAEGVIAPAGAKVTGATIRTWLLNKFISFLAVLTWKTGLKKM